MNRILSAAIAAAFAIAAPAVTAQSVEAGTEAPFVLAAASAGEGAGAPRAGRGERGERGERTFRSASERVEARLAHMRTALRITDAQQPQWDSFANVLRRHATERDKRIGEFRGRRADGAQRPDRQNMSAIDRMEFMQKRMAERSARLTEVIAAAKPLYATFSPEQKQAADEMFSRQGRGGHHRDHRDRGQRGMHRGT